MTCRVRVIALNKSFPRYHRGERPRTLRQWLSQGPGHLTEKGVIEVLTDINFELKTGEVLGIIGRNGAGKSTLLRLVGGVGMPDSGSIELVGRTGALLELGTGTHPDLTGRDNAIVSGIIAGLSRTQVLERMSEIVRFAELEEFIDSPLRTYSTGMQMRLTFSVIVHSNPEILLVDEVLSVGDMAFQEKCLARIRKLKEAGCTILLATHDLSQVIDICDRCLWLNEGQQTRLGKPNEVINEFQEEMSLKTQAMTPAPRLSDKETERCDTLVLQKNRLGSQEVKIIRVELQDADGQEISSNVTGRPLKVMIHFEAENPVEGAIVGVSISDEKGRVCLEVSSKIVDDTGTSLQGKSEAELNIFGLDMRPDSYFVDVGIYEKDWQYAYDYHWHVYPLEVTTTSRPTDQEPRGTAHKWKIQR